MSLENKIKELELEIKKLKRKEKLSEQALQQNSVVSKKYNEILDTLKQKEHFTSTIIESNKNAIIAINEQQIVTIFNKSAENMFGFSKHEMLNKVSLHNIIPDYLIKKYKKASKAFMKSKKLAGTSTNIELKAKHKDGTLFPIRIGFGIEIEEDMITVIANIENITIEKETQNNLENINIILEEKVMERTKDLEEQYKYLQTIIDGVHEPIMVIDADYNVTLKNYPVEIRINKNFIADLNNPKCYEVSHQRSSPCDSADHPCILCNLSISDLAIR